MNIWSYIKWCVRGWDNWTYIYVGGIVMTVSPWFFSREVGIIVYLTGVGLLSMGLFYQVWLLIKMNYKVYQKEQQKLFDIIKDSK